MMQDIARFPARLPCVTELTGRSRYEGGRIASSFAPQKRISRRQLSCSGAPCALAAMEAQSVQELY